MIWHTNSSSSCWAGNSNTSKWRTILWAHEIKHFASYKEGTLTSLSREYLHISIKLKCNTGKLTNTHTLEQLCRHFLSNGACSCELMFKKPPPVDHVYVWRLSWEATIWGEYQLFFWNDTESSYGELCGCNCPLLNLIKAFISILIWLRMNSSPGIEIPLEEW